MAKLVSCADEALLLVRFEEPCLGDTGLNHMNKLRLVLAQKFETHTISHLGNAFERVHYSVSDSTFNDYFYVWLLGEYKDHVNLF